MSNVKISPWISNADDFTSQSTDEVDGTINWWKPWYWNGSRLVDALPVLDLQQNVPGDQLLKLTVQWLAWYVKRVSLLSLSQQTLWASCTQ